MTKLMAEEAKQSFIVARWSASSSLLRPSCCGLSNGACTFMHYLCIVPCIGDACWWCPARVRVYLSIECVSQWMDPFNDGATYGIVVRHFELLGLSEVSMVR
jgi:hypothetical protein